jgi:hypothetical protein
MAASAGEAADKLMRTVSEEIAKMKVSPGLAKLFSGKQDTEEIETIKQQLKTGIKEKIDKIITFIKGNEALKEIYIQKIKDARKKLPDHLDMQQSLDYLKFLIEIENELAEKLKKINEEIDQVFGEIKKSFSSDSSLEQTFNKHLDEKLAEVTDKTNITQLQKYLEELNNVNDTIKRTKPLFKKYKKSKSYRKISRKISRKTARKTARKSKKRKANRV